MCGRFTYKFTWRQLYELYNIHKKLPSEPIFPQFNVPPMANVPIIRQDQSGDREAVIMRWWLVPFWAERSKPEYAMFNARSEDAESKPAFREPFRKRRCVLPANGFYEWTKGPSDKKKPYFIHRRDDAVFSFAGLWDRWVSKETGEIIESCTILTAAAGDLLKPINHRTPLVIAATNLDQWLSRNLTDVTETKTLMSTPSPDEYVRQEVSSYVNNARNQGERCIEPI